MEISPLSWTSETNDPLQDRFQSKSASWIQKAKLAPLLFAHVCQLHHVLGSCKNYILLILRSSFKSLPHTSHKKHLSIRLTRKKYRIHRTRGRESASIPLSNAFPWQDACVLLSAPGTMHALEKKGTNTRIKCANSIIPEAL